MKLKDSFILTTSDLCYIRSRGTEIKVSGLANFSTMFCTVSCPEFVKLSEFLLVTMGAFFCLCGCVCLCVEACRSRGDLANITRGFKLVRTFQSITQRKSGFHLEKLPLDDFSF